MVQLGLEPRTLAYVTIHKNFYIGVHTRNWGNGEFCIVIAYPSS